MPDSDEIFEDRFVRCDVVKEKGLWVVYVEVGDSESSVRHRINAYYKKSMAEIAAKWIRRTAEKEIPFNRQKL